MTPAVPNEAKLYSGQTLGEFHISEFLAGGNFGLVFAGEHTASGQPVAIKVLSQKAGAEGLIEFFTERDLLRELRPSSSVVRYIDDGEEFIIVEALATGAQAPITAQFLVMELAAGCFEELLANRSELGWNDRLQLLRGAVRGVHQMHLKDMVHRDIKSTNCLLFLNGNETRSKISDLGRARDLTQPARFTARQYLAGRGDLRFAPPELLWLQGVDDAHVWKRADVYGLGSLLFETATGQGITGIALGSGPRLAQQLALMAPAERHSDFRSRIAELRARYSAAHDIFAAEVPPSIRKHATELLRQLCDPDPMRRLPQIAPGRRRSPDGGLEWLLKRITILQKTLHNAERQAARLVQRKQRTHATNS